MAAMYLTKSGSEKSAKAGSKASGDSATVLLSGSSILYSMKQLVVLFFSGNQKGVTEIASELHCGVAVISDMILPQVICSAFAIRCCQRHWIWKFCWWKVCGHVTLSRQLMIMMATYVQSLFRTKSCEVFLVLRSKIWETTELHT